MGKPEVAYSLSESAYNQAKRPSGPLPHHPEGRIQFLRFRTLDVLNTYVPNNGWKRERHEVRKDWDRTVLNFVVSRRQVR